MLRQRCDHARDHKSCAAQELRDRFPRHQPGTFCRRISSGKRHSTNFDDPELLNQQQYGGRPPSTPVRIVPGRRPAGRLAQRNLPAEWRAPTRRAGATREKQAQQFFGALSRFLLRAIMIVTVG
jgi:hypothetical protein